ncbi:MAG TPA: hypothetical protein VF215_17310 [Thermoanaerobaculia bacterium]
MTKAVVRYQPAVPSLAAKRDVTQSATDAVRTLIQRTAEGGLTPRRAKRLALVLGHAEQIVESLIGIAEDSDRMTVAAAAAARDIEQCTTAIDTLMTTRAANAVTRKEAAEREKHVAGVVHQEMRVQRLTAEVRAEELTQRLNALKAARPPHAKAATVTPAAQNSGPTCAKDADDAALLSRLSTEATSVLREIQAGVVLADARHPYHAFAGCLYLRARLDGDDAAAAALRARDELIAHMREDREFTPAERKEFRREYAALKKRLAATADTRQGATLLSMLKHVGAASAPANGNGAP